MSLTALVNKGKIGKQIRMKNTRMCYPDKRGNPLAAERPPFPNINNRIFSTENLVKNAVIYIQHVHKVSSALIFLFHTLLYTHQFINILKQSIHKII